ncbi:MAG: hypothetical protein AAF432_06820 [Planctomycetota bacterium]
MSFLAFGVIALLVCLVAFFGVDATFGLCVCLVPLTIVSGVFFVAIQVVSWRPYVVMIMESGIAYAPAPQAMSHCIPWRLIQSTSLRPMSLAPHDARGDPPSWRLEITYRESARQLHSYAGLQLNYTFEASPELAHRVSEGLRTCRAAANDHDSTHDA